MAPSPEKTIKVKITSAVAIGGQIKSPGTTVTVPESVARNLLHRGRCELVGEPKDDGDLSDLKVPDLKELADELGIQGTSSMKREDLVEAIKAAQAD